MKVSVRKNDKQNNFEIVYEMDSASLKDRLNYVSQKVKNLEKAINIYSQQLETLKSEEAQLKQILNDEG